MRKIIVSMNITLDGFMSGPDRDLDWHVDYWTGEMAETLGEQLSRADTILLGRVTYHAMASYWPFKAMDMSLPREDIAYAEMMNNYEKLVFSKSLTRLPWNNSRILKGNMKAETLRLKKMPGRDIIVYGSGQIVSSLAQFGLVDEYHLWVHPVVLGKGRPLFEGTEPKASLRLADTREFKSGVVLLYYSSSKRDLQTPLRARVSIPSSNFSPDW